MVKKNMHVDMTVCHEEYTNIIIWIDNLSNCLSENFSINCLTLTY